MATDGAVDRGEPKGVADDVVHPSVTGAEDGSCVWNDHIEEKQLQCTSCVLNLFVSFIYFRGS